MSDSHNNRLSPRAKDLAEALARLDERAFGATEAVPPIRETTDAAPIRTHSVRQLAGILATLDRNGAMRPNGRATVFEEMRRRWRDFESHMRDHAAMLASLNTVLMPPPRPREPGAAINGVLQQTI